MYIHDTLNKDAKPLLLDPLPENIPAKLKRYRNRWSLWEAKWDPAKKAGKGGWNKRPVRLDGHTGLSSQTAWFSFESALAAYNVQSFANQVGLGFVITRCEHLTILDLDGCVSPLGKIEPWAQEIIDRAGTYAEFSPSGVGLRVAGLGRAAVDWTNHDSGIECYAGHAARFLTFTGHRLPGVSEDLREFPPGFLDAIQGEFRGVAARPDREPPPDMPELVDVVELPRLEQLRLPLNVKDFLETGACGHGDGSRILFNAAIALLEATATPDGRLKPDVVLSVLADNPHAWDIALRHRRDDEDRAMEYLWRHHVLPGMAKAEPVVFDELGDEPAGTSGERVRSGLETFTAASLHGQPVPARQWLVPKVVPVRTVTLLSGDGGTGKSLLALQLGVAVATKGAWLGLPCADGSALYLAAEDDTDEVHRRLADICAAEMRELEELGALHVAPLAGRDAVLAEATARGGKLSATELWKAVRLRVSELRPALVIFDTLADLFAANENDRSLAQQFIALLRGLCTEFGATVLLLSHPSLSGMASGAGTSGSTAWNNSVRSRLYLKRPEGAQADTPLRQLEVMKSNYAAKGEAFTLRWNQGAFTILAEGDKAADEEARRAENREHFLAMLERFTKAEIVVSQNPGRSFAPSRFADDPDGGGLSKSDYAVAMRELIAAGVVGVEAYGPPSKRRHRLTIAANRDGV